MVCCNTCSCDCDNLREQVRDLKAQIETLTDSFHSVSINGDSHNQSTVSTAQTDIIKQATVESQTDDAVTDSSVGSVLSAARTDNSEKPESEILSFPGQDPPLHDNSEKPDSENVSLPGQDPPYELYPNQPFAQCSMSELDRHTQPHYQSLFPNRCVAYYGIVPYSYGKVLHHPVPFEDNSYLLQIVTLLKDILPNFFFNSALITKFRDGNDNIGFHSDDEPSIISNSDIITVSLGETRTLVFEPKISGGSTNRTLVSLTHGDLYGMSRKSQDVYRHGIWKDYSTQPRISITFRLLSPPISPSPSTGSSPRSPSANNPSAPSTHSSPSPPTNTEHISTVYISSSMFRNLNASKLSTDKQTAAVLYYPGATAGTILNKLKMDSNFSKIDPKHVKKVFLLCGTNNVDRILGIPRSHDKAVVENRYTNFSNRQLCETKTEVQNLLMYLHGWSPSAVVNVLNILPRESRARNEVINELNSFISYLATSNTYINFVSTELNRNLFCNNQGYRNNYLFNFRGKDNVHMNTLGQSKLAKLLKHLAHVR